ncbi:disease resistance protein RGA4-like [Triticum dicoccoides]|uniref:disease resistance protein RGA4-like n=1 Tax=Triticum dicoccoides TaxID=85692 RepID=UPI00189177B5|nr:disease resistance protein RGA4-like [Triticum dicoccoides]
MAVPVQLELAAARPLLNATVGYLASEIQGRYNLWKSVEDECESLKGAVVLLASVMDDDVCDCKHDHRRSVALRATFTEQMRELAHDIEDCIERFLHRVTCKEGASWAYRAFHRVRIYPTRHKFASKMKQLKMRWEKTTRQIQIFNPPSAGGGQSSAPATTSPAESVLDDPVGIEEAKKELLALLVEPIQSMVIAIVGFGGSGKTTLAEAVYNSVDKRKLDHALVSARSLDGNGILREIHQKAFPDSATSLKESIAGLAAEDKRYLIVIDDITAEHIQSWSTIWNTLKGGGTIIVTTAVLTIANTCINNPRQENICSLGYVYRMRTLGEEDSKKMAFRGRWTTELERDSPVLLKKCDGLPLALTSVANKFSSLPEPTGRSCQDLSAQLGEYVEHEDDKEPHFARLRGVLMDNYTSLSDYTARTCLLYLGIWPVDRPLRRSVIIRRWLAEGYARGSPPVTDLMMADTNLQTFINRSIIRPVYPTNNETDKVCKTIGIMHVFMLHKSMSRKFIMPFGSEDKKVRHLFVDDKNVTNLGNTSSPDLSSVRSLTVWGNAGDAIADFRKYKVMRVLDLEGCIDVNDGHLKNICKLWNLRYLSLGPNVASLPKEIAQLKLLETLDVSKSNVDVLPVEVIGLPCLLNLIGNVKLPDPAGTESSENEERSKESKLETLAGFVADGRQGFLEFMVHMKRLKKVKIWCEDVDQLWPLLNVHLVEAIEEYTKAPIHYQQTRSLSIDFPSSLHALGDMHNRNLRSETKYYLTTLKLRGSPAALPEFVSLFPYVSELCLSPTNVTRKLPRVLSKMQCLLYLKLIFSNVDHFVIEAGDFLSLRRLRFEWHRTGLILPTIEDGALPDLVSFQLICRHLVGLSGIEIAHLKQLKDIALHRDVAPETREKWEEAARKHPRRPNVWTITRVGDTRDEDPTVAREESATDQAGTQVVAGGSSVTPEEEALDQNGIVLTIACVGDTTRNENPTVAKEESAIDQAVVEQGSSVAPEEEALDQKGIQQQIVDEEPSEVPSSSSSGSGHTGERGDASPTHCISADIPVVRQETQLKDGLQHQKIKTD